MTRTSRNWTCKPGSFDTLNARTLFISSSPWGFPDLLPQTFTDIPADAQCLPYRHRRPRPGRDIMHTFLDDYRFEVLWNRPRQALLHVQRYWAVCTPDFSLYTDWPLALQQWNTYRSRWCGRWWQSRGLKVIPTVNWSTPDSYAWCWAGIPQGQIVAVGVPDLRQAETRRLFVAGYGAMLAALHPRLVLVYGTLPPDCQGLAPVREYPPEWLRLRQWNRQPQLPPAEVAIRA